jgi:hypothetical protein
MPAKQININDKGWIVNSDARVGIKKALNDSVTWKAVAGSGPWIIAFISNSPFASSTFNVPPGGTVNSGPITATYNGAPVKFRYEVQNGGGTVIDDPDVILEG